tara:strand:+ start:139 stop:381 length:243 start_codon:yes stop_codon:yes gene_type:complete
MLFIILRSAQGVEMLGGLCKGGRRARVGDSGWTARVGGMIKVLVNATLDVEGRKAVFNHWEAFVGAVGDLIKCGLARRER